MFYHIKVYFKNQTRRWRIQTFHDLRKKCSSVIDEIKEQKAKRKQTLSEEEKQGIQETQFTYEYKDSDGDWIVLSNNEEWREATRIHSEDETVLIRVTPQKKMFRGGRGKCRRNRARHFVGRHEVCPGDASEDESVQCGPPGDLPACLGRRRFGRSFRRRPRWRRNFHPSFKQPGEQEEKVEHINQESPVEQEERENKNEFVIEFKSEEVNKNDQEHSEEQENDQDHAKEQEENDEEVENQEGEAESEKREENDQELEEQEQQPKEEYEYQGSLDTLRQMGFTNTALCKHLLNFHKGNVTASIDNLIQISQQ